MNKKVTSILLVAALITSLFTGCKDSSNGNNSGEKSSAVEQTSTGEQNTGKENPEKAEEAVELTWYTIGTPQKDVDIIESELNPYLLEKINATVNLVQFDWGEYTEKMQVKIASGENFDIMFTCSWANDFATNVARGALLPLNDLIDQYGAGIKDNLNPLFLEGASINGSIYGLPTNKELGWQAMWIINKDLADKYEMNLDEITTLESLEPYLQIIKDNEPDVVPLALDKNSTPFVPNLDGGIMGDNMPFVIRFDEPTKILNKYETEEFYNISKTMYEYDKKGFLDPDRTVTQVDVKDGKYFIAKAHYQPYAEVLWRNGDFSSNEIAIRPVHEPFANNGSTRGAMQGISVTSQHPEKAMEFLNLLYTDKYVINLLDFGVEGVHYEKLDENYVRQTEQGKTQWAFPAFSVGNLFNTLSFEGTPEDKWEKFKEFNDNCIDAPTLGFTPDLESVKTQIAFITNVNEEFAGVLNLGMVDPDEYISKLNDKLYEAGLQEVIDELQRQYDEWLKKK